jgi:ligand-binding sensor domain-containing protein
VQDRQGALWFGTWGGGVNRYDGTALTNLSEKHGLCSNVVQGILEDSTGSMWFATRGGGVCRYDGRSFITYATKGDAISYHSIFIAADSAGVLWVGSVGGGLRRFDGTGFVPVAEPDLVNVTCMLQRSTGERWYGSDGSGVYRSNGRAFASFTTKNGMASNSVRAIVEGKSGSLWFCTRKGLCRYDGRSFTHLSEE